MKEDIGEEVYISQYYPDTCRWILDTPVFREFVDEVEHNESILCIQGALGSGKSVLARFLIDELGQNSIAQDNESIRRLKRGCLLQDNDKVFKGDVHTVLKYFFSSRPPAKSDILTLIKSLLYQLLSQDRQLLEHWRKEPVFRRFQSHRDSLERQLLVLLSAHHTSRVFVIIDALNECRTDNLPDVQKLLTQLASISGLKLIITSRPSLLVRATQYIVLDSGHSGTERDVKRYVTSEVQAIATRKMFPKYLIDEIISSIVAKSACSFLKAKLLLRNFDSYRPGQTVREVIQAIPEGLSHMYFDRTERMDFLIRTRIMRALYFVVNAKTTLKLSQLSALIALSKFERTFSTWVNVSEKRVGMFVIRTPCMNEIVENAPAQLERDIHNYCSTLLTIDGTEVRPIHSSICKFLEEENKSNEFFEAFMGGPGYQSSLPFPIGQGSLHEIVHGVMAILCLQYIFAAFHEEEAKENAFDFTEYACSFWTEHVRKAGKAISSPICCLVKELLCSEDNYFSFWVEKSVGSELLSLNMRSHTSRMATTLSAFDLWESLGDELGLWDYDVLENQNDEAQTPFHIAAAFNAVSSIKYIWDHSNRRKDLSILVDNIKHPLSPLHRAVANQHLEAVQTLLKYASSELEFSNSLFQLAVDSGRSDLFGLLSARIKPVTEEDRLAMLRYAITLGLTKRVKKIVDANRVLVHKKDEFGNTLLHLAANQESISICNTLLKRGVDPNRVNDRGDTPLHTSCNKGYTKIANLLLDHNAMVNWKNQDGRPALHLAAVAEYDELLELLLQHGANLFARDHQGETALHLSACSGAEDNVRILLSHGAEANALDARYRTPLHHAIQLNNASSLCIMHHLFGAGADINSTDIEGMAPLHLAARQGAHNLVAGLLEFGADVQAGDLKKQTPLHHAILSDNDSRIEVIRLLFEYDAEVNVEDNEGMTPLHLAVNQDALDIVVDLLAHGATVNSRNSEGITPLHLAAQQGFGGVATELYSHGADVQAVDFKGRSALDCAKENGQEYVANILSLMR